MGFKSCCNALAISQLTYVVPNDAPSQYLPADTKRLVRPLSAKHHQKIRTRGNRTRFTL